MSISRDFLRQSNGRRQKTRGPDNWTHTAQDTVKEKRSYEARKNLRIEVRPRIRDTVREGGGGGGRDTGPGPERPGADGRRDPKSGGKGRRGKGGEGGEERVGTGRCRLALAYGWGAPLHKVQCDRVTPPHTNTQAHTFDR